MADSDDEDMWTLILPYQLASASWQINSKLSASTLSALQEFYSERDERAKQFEDLKVVSEQKHDEKHRSTKQPLSMSAFAEDWNESQFWYSDETATLLARKLLDGATGIDVIAVVCAPSVFVQVVNLLVSFFAFCVCTIREKKTSGRLYRWILGDTACGYVVKYTSGKKHSWLQR